MSLIKSKKMFKNIKINGYFKGLSKKNKIVKDIYNKYI